MPKELTIKKNPKYGESNITIVGITRASEDKPKLIIVDSDDGANKGVKFPGLRFHAPLTENMTLEHCAVERFQEQTGLKMDYSLGLRCIVPTRSRHANQWAFRNVFFGVVSDLERRLQKDNRNVYLMDLGTGRYTPPGQVYNLESKTQAEVSWVHPDNSSVARHAFHVVNHMDWQEIDSDWFRRIPCVPSEPQTPNKERELGCGLAVSSILLLYQPAPNAPRHIILLKLKEDEHPGYAGGKIETPDKSRTNVDPISCCAQEGAEEFGFPIIPKALVCVATTALHQPADVKSYNSIVTYAFIAEPTNQRDVQEALKRGKPPEDKMECYVVEELGEHKKRIDAGHLRMPDMIRVGKKFYMQPPGKQISLAQIVPSGLE